MANPRNIIVLDVQQAPSQDASGNPVFTTVVTAALWLTAPPNRQVPISATGTVSAVPAVSVVSWGITNAESNQIVSGQIVEVVVRTSGKSFAPNPPSPVASITDAHAELASLFAIRQAALTATANPNPNEIGASSTDGGATFTNGNLPVVQ